MLCPRVPVPGPVSACLGAEVTRPLSRRCARGPWASAWSTTTCGRDLSVTTTSPSRRGWAGGNTARREPRACSGLPGPQGGRLGVPGRLLPFTVRSPHRDADQDLDSSDPDGTGRPRSSPPLPPAADSLGSEQDPLARMHTGENVGWVPAFGGPSSHWCSDLGPRGSIPGTSRWGVTCRSGHGDLLGCCVEGYCVCPVALGAMWAVA